jgi:hypothetical protein
VLDTAIHVFLPPNASRGWPEQVHDVERLSAILPRHATLSDPQRQR